ncbi:hypothetical protein DENSPDRAFT_833101 [Dentipellis sp. KUC8613]|nr:hypothetical protein DENSPDRAFT_833101 [Dentipellis sp. KUC8613]
MSDPCTPEERLTLETSRHRSAASLSTTVSGIADSTISFNTYATGITAESLRLSQFPPPPTTVPSPTSSNPLSTPTTPVFRSPQHSASSHQTTSPLILRQKGTTSPPTAFPPGSPTSSAELSSFPRRGDYGRVPAHRNNLLPSARSDASHGSLASPPSSGLSPYDWHEGSSSISVDPAEERLLSTSFITGLLSATSRQSSESQAAQPRGTASEIDTGSLVSELTYPPSRVVHSPSAFTSYPPSYTDSLKAAPNTPNTVPPTLPDSDAGGDTDTLRDLEADIGIPRDVRRTSRTATNMGSFQARSMSRNSGATSRASPATFDSSIPLRPIRSPSTGMTASFDGADVGNIAYNGASTSMLYSPAAPSSVGVRPKSNFKSHERRASTNSHRTTRSQAPSFISRISQSSAAQRSARALKQTAEWFRVKPLPPVPRLPHMVLAEEQEHRRLEAVVPLPDLAQRAEILNNMLAAGHRPHHSVGSLSQHNESSVDKPWEGHAGMLGSSSEPVTAQASGRKKTRGGRKRQSLQVFPNTVEEDDNPSPSKSRRFRLAPQLTRTNKIKLAVGACVVLLLVIIGVVVGIVVGGKHKSSTVSCSGNLTGNACSLDGTCVCASSSSGQCNHLAQSLVELTPTANKLLGVNMTPDVVAAAMFAVQGTPVNGNCAAQAKVVDVAPGLDPQTMPNRTQWAQSALLWSFVQSQDPTAVGKLQEFVQKANWGSLSNTDGPENDQSSAFKTTSLGFNFDFASQTVSEPQVLFQNDGQPSSAQAAQVSDTARGALDRMYSFATASSTQQRKALENYWQAELQQDPNKLNLFISLISSSPILLPFDATASPGGNNISAQLTNSSSTPFPPPISCYPSLSSSQTQLLNSIETTVFGLSASSSQNSFNPSCYPDRPIYGVLDVLRLRLPFLDSTSGVARQAAVLSRDVSPRSVVYVGPILSALPASLSSNVSASIAMDPLQYGTLNHMNSVLLNFFSAIPDIKTAIAFAQFVLSSPAVPPANSTALGQLLASLPSFEVAVFGSIVPSDISSVVSSFSTPSGDLFFGTDQSLALRDWAIVGTQTSVEWTDSANASTAVQDSSLTDATFNAVWTPAFTFFHSNTDAHVDVGNITSAFQSLGKFQP